MGVCILWGRVCVWKYKGVFGLQIYLDFQGLLDFKMVILFIILVYI